MILVLKTNPMKIHNNYTNQKEELKQINGKQAV